jgi:hypothetical protein
MNKMKVPCNHDYVIIKEHEIKSQMQIMLEHGLSASRTHTSSIFKSKYVIVYKCRKCKKIKETVIDNE